MNSVKLRWTPMVAVKYSGLRKDVHVLTDVRRSLAGLLGKKSGLRRNLYTLRRNFFPRRLAGLRRWTSIRSPGMWEFGKFDGLRRSPTEFSPRTKRAMDSIRSPARTFVRELHVLRQSPRKSIRIFLERYNILPKYNDYNDYNNLLANFQPIVVIARPFGIIC